MSDKRDEPLAAIREAEAFVSSMPSDTPGGALGKAGRARQRITDPFRRPQHAIDSVLLAAIRESNREARERAADLEERMDWAELEVARLTAEMSQRESRLKERLNAIEASLELISARLNEPGTSEDPSRGS